MESAFPYYLSIGMTPAEYWDADPFLVKAFEKANELRRAEANYQAWLQGLYCYQGTQTAFNFFSWGFGGKKGKRPDGYLEYPIPVTEMEKKAEAERKRKHTLEWFEKGQNTNSTEGGNSNG